MPSTSLFGKGKLVTFVDDTTVPEKPRMVRIIGQDGRSFQTAVTQNYSFVVSPGLASDSRTFGLTKTT